jgi:hypothetical protein
MTSHNIPHCNIIYGYTKTCLDNMQDSPVLLIEPRSEYIDMIKNIQKTNRNVILISKILTNSKCTSEIPFFYHKKDDYYWISNEDDQLTINGNNLFDIKKHIAYPVTLRNIIIDYNIQNIEKLIVNIKIKNIQDILDSILSYNHIISNIILTKFYENVKPKILTYYHTDVENEYILYIHKNLNVDLPNIGLYLLNDDKRYNKDMSLFINQYKINIILQSNESPSEVNFIPYPDSVQVIESINTKQTKIYYDNIIDILHGIFSKTPDTISDKLDIIIQFNPKHFSTKNTLQIMYPLKDNTIYVNKLYDIMYATKNCMFMLYQILKSKYFTDYIEQKRSEKPKIFKIFAKRYFYEYISKIFVLQDFN